MRAARGSDTVKHFLCKALLAPGGRVRTNLTDTPGLLFDQCPTITDFSLPVCDNNHLAISKVQLPTWLLLFS
jgi:hypothetical protein